MVVFWLVKSPLKVMPSQSSSNDTVFLFLFRQKMATRRAPKERVIIEEIRFFLDPNYKEVFTSFDLTSDLKFDQPIPDISIEKNDLLVAICGEDVRGWSIEKIRTRIQKQKQLAPTRYEEGPWYSMGNIEVTDFSLTCIRSRSVNQAIANNLLDKKKVTY